MKPLAPLLALGCVAAALAAGAAGQAPRPERLGVFSAHGDVGAVKIAGSAAYDEAAGDYTLTASGANVWGTSDELHFAWREIEGDFILQARVNFVSVGELPSPDAASKPAHNPHRKVGLMARSSLDPASPHVTVTAHGDGLTALQFRRVQKGETEEIRSDRAGSDVLQLERRGNTWTALVARFGEPYAVSRVDDVKLGARAHVGIFLCSHEAEVVETAVLHNVRLIRPAPEGFTPYRDYLGSLVEVLDVETGRRRVVHTVADSMQAPNWTNDGRRLVMNRNGRIYSFELETRAVAEIDTAPMTRNNNDHALSFDGTMLGLSGGQPSTVWTVPAGGGTARQITPAGPSYLHGWSADGKLLAFTGQREGDYDIYVVPAGGGPERRLTTAPGLDDGPEFTPDGKWIYFNSTRSGRMQVWRMRPDGSGQEQLTFDDFNNWFPHVSPDGTRVVFITYGPEVAPDDHPWYKRVYLRTMPLDGGAPRVVAYVYGGQGSMNVNSWAPDSRRLAFVSNSGELP
ncbi:MAG TPA: hypothetical protein PKK95_09805 [Vicinamibacterales bacterium]|nr:hypothetical protein [Vicinamibacterales bacterium]